MPETIQIIAIPGTMCDQRLWEPLLAHLSEQFDWHHLAIPTPNEFNMMDSSQSESISVSDLVEKLTDNLQHLNIDFSQPIHCLGFSMGGYLATELVKAFPEKFASLSIVGNTPVSLPSDELKERQRTIALLQKYGYSGISKLRIQQLLHPSQHSNEAIIDVIRAMDTDLGSDILLHQLQSTSHRHDMAAFLLSTDIPVRFCLGDHDSLLKIDWLNDLKATANQIDISTFASCGHMIPLEQPKQFAHWLASKFL